MEDCSKIQNASQSSKNTMKLDDYDQTMQYDKLIQTYLNTKFFYQSQIETENQFQKYRNTKNHEISLKHTQTSKLSSSMIKKEIKPKKSIFHNFQKHLITTLKRYIIIESKQQMDETNQAVSQIWSTFIKTNSYNKKLLQIVFGVSCPKKMKEEEILKTLSMQFPYFRDLITVYETNIILSAQKILRDEVSEQARHLTFLLLKSNCHITKFNDFYTYFCEFMREIREGPVSRRISKNKSVELKRNSDLLEEN